MNPSPSHPVIFFYYCYRESWESLHLSVSLLLSRCSLILSESFFKEIAKLKVARQQKAPLFGLKQDTTDPAVNTFGFEEKVLLGPGAC